MGLMTCGGRPFPESALVSRPAGIDVAGPDVAAALREAFAIYVDIYGDLSNRPWVLAAQDDFGATFLASQGDRWLQAPVFAGKADWVPGTIDSCVPHEFGSSDYGQAAWRLDPDFAEPTAESTEIHVLVTEQACASGSSPASRLVPPMVSYSSRELTIQMGVRGLGMATCPGNPALPVTVVLPEPLGDRDLVGDSPAQF
jgi:hypothetical protein